MKKFGFVFIAAALTLLAVSPAFAAGMMFGVKGGLNLANLTGDDVSDASIKTGVGVGAFLTYDLTEIFGVQPEVLFTMKGAKVKDVDLGDVTWKVSYIEIPVLVKVNLPTGGNVKPALFVGPGFGFLLSSKLSDGDEVDVKDATTSTDIGIIVGAGIAYKMEKGAITFDARYEVGMTTIVKEEDEDTGSKPDVKNSVISFMVGYAFAF
jgi:hypothetical protein